MGCFCYCPAITSVEIPNTVTMLGEGAFADCTALSSISLSNSILMIDNLTFKDCTSLTSITIPKSVVELTNQAFYGCKNLSEILVDEGNYYFASKDGVLFDNTYTYLYCCPAGKTGDYAIPSTVTTIGNLSFSNCKLLTSISIPNSVSKIEYAAFEYCSSLTSLAIPNSVTKIESGTFMECSKLKSITLPNSLKVIEYYAFTACSSLTEISLPSTLTEIGIWAFLDCISLKDIYIPNSVTTLAAGCFEGCTALTSVRLPEGLSTIEGHVFYKCSSLKSITIPESVTSIGFTSFNGCSSLANVSIPRAVMNIEEYAFFGCKALLSILLPSTVSNIGDGAFSECSSLTGIDVDSDNRFYESIDGVLYDKEITKIYCYPAGKAGEYSFPATVNSIAYDAFAGSQVTSISVPNTVTEIGGWAFSNCSNLTSISIPNTINTLKGTFSGCSSLEKIIDFNPVPQEAEMSTFSGLPSNTIIYVPQGSRTKYAKYYPWSMAFGLDHYREMGEIELSITPGDVTLGQGDMLALQVDIIKDGDVTVDMEEWSSSDPSVATVDGDGNVTGLSVGSATITYTVTDCYGVVQTASCNVNVVDPSGIEDVVIDGNDSCEVFNLQGLFVGDSLKGLTPGIYIVKQGTTTRKVVIK